LRPSNFLQKPTILLLKILPVNKRFFFAFILCFSLIFTFFSCKKINEATTLGGDIIPGADGVNTFEINLPVEAYNGLFDGITDSISMSGSEDHFLGNISLDPLFGKTNAKIFLELKPSFNSGKWTFSGIVNPDSLHLDSVVMVLGWHGTYGDSTLPQRVRVYEMDQSNDFRYDTAYQIREQVFTYSNLLGSKDVIPASLRDSIKAFRDTTANQLRIKLSDAFGNRILKGTGYDSSGAYASDSAFRTYFKGFSLDTDPSFGNALMAFGVNSTSDTKLAIYYHYDKNGVSDTTVDYFTFNATSAHHNFINRNLTGTPILAAQGGTTPDDYIYLLNVPGSYATVKVPGLRTLDKTVIHRAELVMEEVYDNSDKIFIPPQTIYLDVFDSALLKYKAVPYDFILDNTGAGYGPFGVNGSNALDGFGNTIRTWRFNLTRYVQNIITNKEPVHDFRVLSHRVVYDEYRTSNGNNTGDYVTYGIPMNSLYAIGRVRVGGGNHPTQKMRLRIIYSKI